MAILLCGLLLFIAPHLLRETGLRGAALAALPSTGAYRAVFSLCALAGIVLIVIGKSGAPFVMVWQPLFELRYISNVLMIPAVILVVAGNLPPGYLRSQLRNPMLLGVFLWGVAHLWSNGDLASMLLFGMFTLWAGYKFVARGLTEPAQPFQGSLLWDGVALVAGLVVYALISIYHGDLFGVGLSLE